MSARDGSRLSGRPLDHLLQLARLVHLNHQVAPADELPVDVALRDRRPAGVFLDALADGGVLKDVADFVGNVHRVEDLHGGVGEAALREELVAFHKENDGARVDELLDLRLGGGLEHAGREYARARVCERGGEGRRGAEDHRGGEGSEEKREGSHGSWYR
eukprot:CAMPEP_0113246582 /NCGR_PEP_ID=MMETSP0008_2-20120614/9536_1 /TAXON_ID=97485 /ORGANISM="Prymnesium parvum" /LENGTH=159 /DNA_ID=CAMNT_0000094325 /DNA_START=217 /DNA_END=693 /DNA_ORIENTATION=+ /assembly_acc=CAM_ASM_000153